MQARLEAALVAARELHAALAAVGAALQRLPALAPQPRELEMSRLEGARAALRSHLAAFAVAPGADSLAPLRDQVSITPRDHDHSPWRTHRLQYGMYHCSLAQREYHIEANYRSLRTLRNGDMFGHVFVVPSVNNHVTGELNNRHRQHENLVYCPS